MGAWNRCTTSVRRIIREHVVAIFLAILATALIALPSIIFRHNPAFQGIDLLGTDGEASYVTQVHAVYNGDVSFGNVFLYEGKDQPYLKQPLPAIITAAFGKIMGLSVGDANIGAKIFFPFITFLVVYALCFTLTKRRDSSLLGALFVLLSPATTALLNPRTWWPLVSKGIFAANDAQFLLHGRPINPQVSSLVFFLYLLLLWMLLTRFETVTRVRKWMLAVAAAAVLGASFYTYLFTFTLLFMMNGCLWLFYALRKQRAHLAVISGITAGGLIVGIPYFLNMWAALHSPFYPDLAVRVGQVVTHAPVISVVLLATAGLFLAVYRRADAFGLFVISLVGGVFLVSNQQVITGHTIPIPDHYHWYYMAPLAGFVLLHIALERVRPFLSRTQLVSGLLIVGLVYIGAAVQFQRWSYATQKDEYIALQTYAPAIAWLRDHTDKNDVVFSNDTFSLLMLVYTRANTYYNRYVGENLVPSERLRQADYAYMYLNGVRAQDAEAYFAEAKNRDVFGRHQFGNYYRAIKGCYDCYPDEYNQQFIREYKDFSSRPLLDNLKKYRLTYFVQDKSMDSAWPVKTLFKEPVFEDQRVVIYKVL